MARRAPGPYQLQAAIIAVHVQAASFADTDWLQIAALYGELARWDPSPVIEINRAVAVGMADGPRAGLAILERDRYDWALLQIATQDQVTSAWDSAATRTTARTSKAFAQAAALAACQDAGESRSGRAGTSTGMSSD